MPSGALLVYVVLIGAGGGGGSGASSPADRRLRGRLAGGAGANTALYLLASANSPGIITIGTGGAGATAISAERHDR